MANSNLRPSTFPLTLLLFTLLLHTSSSLTHNILQYGAKPDGVTDSSKAFSAAWNAACASKVPATISVPKGRFLIGNSIVFNGGSCKNNAITIAIKGTLVAPTNYNVIGNSWCWLSFEYVNGLHIIGGILDGKGATLWACKLAGKSCPGGAASLSFTNSKNVVVQRLTSLNSQLGHIAVNGCQNVKMQGVRIAASGTSPNTDGIHVQESSGVTILNSRIGTGDDCVSIGPGAQNLWIEDIACGPGHGVSVGSLGKDAKEDGVQNVTVTTATFTGTENGLRIKSWARPSSGFARKIVFQHATMINVQNPIVIDQNYCPGNKNCPGQVSGVRVNDVTYNDIHGTSATKVAVKFDCSSKYPCTGIKLQNVNLRFENQGAQATCAHAGGSVSGLVYPSSCL